MLSQDIFFGVQNQNKLQISFCTWVSLFSRTDLFICSFTSKYSASYWTQPIFRIMSTFA